ncbi:WEAK CHLOROPLAST MOVEMENT UNDER BLUE LIGHT protein1 [Spatholobus suberectus]|nr:WEAK CHLOROPLAST MOVEMENT UNDER BLUE LIGHT protein1 [Spatholobus suberectus]
MTSLVFLSSFILLSLCLLLPILLPTLPSSYTRVRTLVVRTFNFCKIMGGEIDTKSIEPVRNAVSLFGDKGDQKKYQSTRSKSDCEKELDDLTKELANCKLQLEAKHAAHMQALLKLEHNQKMIHELSTLLKKSDIERNKNMNECSECRARKDELESKMKEMADHNLEIAKVRDQLLHVLSELKATQRELLTKETELVAARDSELKALTNAKQSQSALEVEKEELLQQVKELHEVIHRSKLAAIVTEKEKLAILSEKDEKIELATKATAQVQQQLEDMRKHVEMLQELQNQPMDKSTLHDSLPLEPKQANETLILSGDSAPKAINDSNQLNIDMELKERKIMDQSVYIETLEMKLSQFKQELTVAKEEINGLNVTNESLRSELHKDKAELNMNKESDVEAQVEIALLRSQLQEQRLAYENGHVTEVCKTDHSKAEGEERNSENKCDHITISLKDCKYLVEKTNGVQESVGEVGRLSELALMKKELENASVKIAELRARAEQALSRAELAENAKAALEDKIRRHREHRQRRRAALTALREESTPKPFSPSSSYGTPGTYQPLGKVLNMKL